MNFAFAERFAELETIEDIFVFDVAPAVEEPVVTAPEDDGEDRPSQVTDDGGGDTANDAGDDDPGDAGIAPDDPDTDGAATAGDDEVQTGGDAPFDLGDTDLTGGDVVDVSYADFVPAFTDENLLAIGRSLFEFAF